MDGELPAEAWRRRVHWGLRGCGNAPICLVEIAWSSGIPEKERQSRPVCRDSHQFRRMLRILIADDHPVVRHGLKQILSEDFPEAEFLVTRNSLETLTA